MDWYLEYGGTTSVFVLAAKPERYNPAGSKLLKIARVPLLKITVMFYKHFFLKHELL